jgi:aminoglycoside phosphotransferase family enzyme
LKTVSDRDDLSQTDVTEIGLREKVTFLRQAENYPFATGRVDVIETHMSWVFLTEKRVYKLKKPVRYSFLDFSTLEARREDSEGEVQLNRRLAGDTYIRAVALTREDNGDLKLGGKGKPVEWLVEMHRLPEELTLDTAIRKGTVATDDIDRISRVLNDFFQKQASLPVTGQEYRAMFTREMEESHNTLSRPEYGLPQERLQHVASAQREFLQRHGGMLEERASNGLVIEGHGDLRPEHVFLTEPPVVIDCLEFNRDFRLLDPVDELAYLGLECERLGATWIGERLLQNYFAESGDACPGELIRFYRLFRACLRAKIAVWHIDDHRIREVEKWRQRARDYLSIAERDLAAGRDTS